MSAGGTITLAFAAFYQIIHAEKKEKKMKPKLIILPSFIGEKPDTIVFCVYNTGESMARGCAAYLTVIDITSDKVENIQTRSVPWTWNEYNKTQSQVGSYFEDIFDKGSYSIDIRPKQKTTLSYITSRTLYGKPLDANLNVPPMRFVIKVEVYAENVSTAAIYPLYLYWTGESFDITTKPLSDDASLVNKLDIKLDKEKSAELFKLRKFTFYKK